MTDKKAQDLRREVDRQASVGRVDQQIQAELLHTAVREKSLPLEAVTLAAKLGDPAALLVKKQPAFPFETPEDMLEMAREIERVTGTEGCVRAGLALSKAMGARPLRNEDIRRQVLSDWILNQSLDNALTCHQHAQGGSGDIVELPQEDWKNQALSPVHDRIAEPEQLVVPAVLHAVNGHPAGHLTMAMKYVMAYQMLTEGISEDEAQFRVFEQLRREFVPWLLHQKDPVLDQHIVHTAETTRARLGLE